MKMTEEEHRAFMVLVREYAPDFGSHKYSYAKLRVVEEAHGYYLKRKGGENDEQDRQTTRTKKGGSTWEG